MVVTSVDPDSLADRAGIMEGDLIREINGMRTASVSDYSKAVASVQKGGYLKMLLGRGNASLFVALRLD